MVKRYREKRLFSAVQFGFENMIDIMGFLGSCSYSMSQQNNVWSITFADGKGVKMTAQQGDWIVKDDDSFRIEKNNVFLNKYEEAKAK